MEELTSCKKQFKSVKCRTQFSQFPTLKFSVNFRVLPESPLTNGIYFKQPVNGWFYLIKDKRKLLPFVLVLYIINCITGGLIKK